ncbi:MAG: 2-keto-3-deoxy-D-arabinonate dehydratase [Acidobacteria bacterium]|nr:2-keto-3-deoxy-D-arabinonate dehydratase [Acidobacteriota bacterium]
MRLGQVRFDNKTTAAIFEGGQAWPVPGYSTVELIRKAETEAAPLNELVREMASHHPVEAAPVIPLNPIEVWACGCTYDAEAGFHCPWHHIEGSIYRQVCQEPRPDLLLKGTARVCVGPGQAIGIRFDSNCTLPEPELAVVLGKKGRIVGYTLANDVWARDIERINPLYRPQSRIYSASCALGPVIVTADELKDPYALSITCTIRRGGEVRFSASVSTLRLRRKLEEVVSYVLRANPVPAGSVLLTGTGIMLGDEHALAPGDVVTISNPEIGELSNLAAMIP